MGSQLHTLTLKRSTGETIPPDVIPLKHRCIDFEQQDSGIEVFFEDGKTVQADLLIGADGANSAVRQGVIGDGTLTYAGRMSWCAVIQ